MLMPSLPISVMPSQPLSASSTRLACCSRRSMLLSWCGLHTQSSCHGPQPCLKHLPHHTLDHVVTSCQHALLPACVSTHLSCCCEGCFFTFVDVQLVLSILSRGNFSNHRSLGLNHAVQHSRIHPFTRVAYCVSTDKNNTTCSTACSAACCLLTLSKDLKVALPSRSFHMVAD